MSSHASMNRIYRLVFNAATGMYVAVAETAKGRGKAGRSASAAMLAALTALGGASTAGAQNVLPTGGAVASGSASISQTASAMTIDQSSSAAILNWQSFSIGAANAVRFNQPSASSVALNRVIGNGASEILGSLSANGRVMLVNQNGILMGSGAQVDTGGFIGSTLNIKDSDFLAGKYIFDIANNTGGTNSVPGTIINNGRINTPSGYAVLIAPQVTNNGFIAARQGTVAIGAGNKVSLDMVGDGLISLKVDQAALNSAIVNTGSINANGGTVLLKASSANALFDTVINSTGIIRADSIANVNGRIILDGGAKGITEVTGEITARGLNAGEAGGQISVLGDKVGLLGSAKLDASGDAGGGTVLVGGAWQGNLQSGGPERNASRTIVGSNASIDVSATNNGNGGTAVVWADGRTDMSGTIKATGGVNGGNGGNVETSGKAALDLKGRVDIAAAKGTGGQWLLDPDNIVISNAASSNLTGTPPTFENSSGIDAVVDATTLGNAINSGATVNVQTNASTAGSGNITVSNAVTAAGVGTLNLIANNSIVVGATIAPAGANALMVGLYAGAGSTGVASIANAGTSAGTITQSAGSINANTLVMVASNGIGGSGTPIQTAAANLSLKNTATGGIYATNTGNVSVAANSVNGDVVIRTANGAVGTVGTVGGNITVGVVNGLSGITTTGTGNVTLTAGNGGNGGSGVVGGNGGSGGAVTVSAALSAAQSVALTAGNGGVGGVGNNGGGGGSGGAVTVNAALNAAQSVALTAGNGGSGGSGVGSPAGSGGSGGAVTMSAAINAAQSVALTAGNGGNGGRGVSAGTAGSGGSGGFGGAVTVTAALNAAQSVALTAGNGGNGGNGVVGGSPGGSGGSGGAVTVSAALNAAQSVALTAGVGGLGGSGQVAGVSGSAANITGSNIDVTAGTNLTVRGAIAASSGNVRLLAGLNAGNTLSLLDAAGTGAGSITVATPASDNITLQADSLATSPVTTLRANVVSLKANVGIGSAGTAVNTAAKQLKLENTTSGGIYATNTGDVSVAANSVNGDVVIRTANGAAGAVGAVGAVGGNITVGVVNGLSGITTTGTGNVTLTAGNGGNGGRGGSGAIGGSGGTVTVSAAINAAQSVALTAGVGGIGGYGDTAHGGSGGSGGTVTVSAALNAAQSVALTAGNGGSGGFGVSGIISPGSAGNITGSNIDVTAGTNLTVRGAIAASSGNVRLLAGLNAGNALSLLDAAGTGAGSITVATPASDNITLQADSLATSPVTTLRANVVSLKANVGIGSAGTAVNTAAKQLKLENTTSGGIYATNTGDVLVAANSVNGDVVIRTANGAVGAVGAVGGNITVGVVNGLSGITTTGTGNVTLTAGNGGGGVAVSGTGGVGGSGGSGGAVTVSAALNAAQSVALTAGNGSVGGVGGSGGGGGGNGGAVTVSAALNAAQSVALTAGNGGVGANGLGGSSGGRGGSSGAVTVSAALNAAQSVALTAGNGGNGGSGFGGGGSGGSGGAVTVSAALNAAQSVALSAGSGGSGGGSGGNGRVSGSGGGGGAITVSAALSAAQSVALTAGNGGSGGSGGFNGFNGGGGNGGNGGAVTVNAALNAAQSVALTAGVGGNGGSGVGSGSSGSPGSAGNITGSNIDVTAGTNLTVRGAIAASSGNVRLLAGLNAGNTLSLLDAAGTGAGSITVATPASDNITLQADSLVTSLVTTLRANAVSLKANVGIGSAGTAIDTEASQLKLENTTSGVINIANTGHAVLAANNTGGDITVQTNAGSTLTVGTVGGLTGLTGSNITLNSGGALAINQVINAGTGTVRLQSTAAITQAVAGVITAANLGARGTAVDLSGAANAVSGNVGINASAGHALYKSASAFNLGSISADGTLFGTATAGMTAVGAGNNVTIDSAGAVTQAAGSDVTASGLLVKGAGAVTLANSTNSVATIAAETGAGAVKYANAGALTVGSVAGVGGITRTGDVAVNTQTGNLNLTQNISTGINTNQVTLQALAGAVNQTAGVITTGALGAKSGVGDVDLGTSTNAVGTTVAFSSAGNVKFKNSGGYQIGAVAADAPVFTTAVDGITGGAVGGNVLLDTSAGTVTQAAGKAITTLNRGLQLNGNAAYILLEGTNNIGKLAASTGAGDISYRNAGAFEIGNVYSAGVTRTGNVTLQTAAALTQTEALTAANLQLLGGQTTTLTNAGNNIASVNGTAAALSLTNSGALALGALTVAGPVTLATGGTVSQTGALTQTGGAAVNITATAGNIKLTNTANDVSGTVNLSAAAGGVAFVNNNAAGIKVGNITAATSMNNTNPADIANFTASDAALTGVALLQARQGNIERSGATKIVADRAVLVAANRIGGATANDATLGVRVEGAAGASARQVYLSAGATQMASTFGPATAPLFYKNLMNGTTALPSPMTSTYNGVAVDFNPAATAAAAAAAEAEAEAAAAAAAASRLASSTLNQRSELSPFELMERRIARLKNINNQRGAGQAEPIDIPSCKPGATRPADPDQC